LNATPKVISYTRFSSAGQADGDSERRQVEAAAAYAKRHGLQIDEELSFQDSGVSAYDRSNLDKGALGAFLGKVKTGEVASGSILLIENFDRLSRAIPLDALALFTAIINAGLTIITLHDEQKFNRETLDKNPFLLMTVFMEAIRANSESKTKSKRVKEAWGEKKKHAIASGKVMSKKTPYWITTKADRSGFELVPERAEVLLWLITESEKGVGNNTLLKMLHDRGVMAWSKSGSWQPSYLQKMLRNPALHGGIRLNGEIVKGYYPPLIEEDRFYRLQGLRTDRATTQATSGRGETLSNLFSGRLKCGYCGFAFAISGYKEQARNPNRKGYERKYMGCHGARIKEPKACPKATIWFVDEFEPKVLFWLTQLDVSQLVGDDSSKLDQEKLNLATLTGLLLESERRAGNIAKAIEEGDAPATLVKRLKELEAEKSKLKAQAAEQQQRVNALSAHQVSGQDRMEKLLKLFKKLKDPTKELQQLEAKLKTATKATTRRPAADPAVIQALTTELEVLTANLAPKVVELRRTRQQLAALLAGVVEKITFYPLGPSPKGSKEDRYFVVTLKSGSSFEVDDSAREEHVAP
jgi:DNA invertase Pin-like site-specific DNA recombinase